MSIAQLLRTELRLFPQRTDPLRRPFATVDEAVYTARFLKNEYVECFDARFGTETSYREFDPPTRDGLRYEPSSVSEFQACLSSIRFEPGNFTFVDLGSGKGRAALIASTRGFRRVVGVEYSARLHEIACRNAARFEAARGVPASIEFRHEDARALVWPREPLFIYLFHPFLEPVLREVVQRLEESLDAFPRPAIVAYVAPERRCAFDESFAFRKVCGRVAQMHRFSIWANRGFA